MRNETNRIIIRVFSLIMMLGIITPISTVHSQALPGIEISAQAFPLYDSEVAGNILEASDIQAVAAPLNYVPYDEAAEKAKAEEAAKAKAKAEAEAKAKANPLASFTQMGKYKLSFYCPCKTCNGNSHKKTASGTTLSVGRTIAVDSSVIPLGSKVYIEGFGEYVAEDTGSSISGNRIDVLVSSHSEAYRLGIKYANVYVKFS